MTGFIDAARRGGCRTFVVHARKAWLEGFSPKENRDEPPIDYGRVYRVKARRPDLTIIVNGGIESLDAAADASRYVDGVMLGRAAYQDPYPLASVDPLLFELAAAVSSRLEVLDRFMPYAEAELARGGAPQSDDAPHSRPVSWTAPCASFRRYLSDPAHLDGAGMEVLEAARRAVAGESLRRRRRVGSAGLADGQLAISKREQALNVEEARRLPAIVAEGAP